METLENPVKSKNLDHYGLVAAVCKDLRIADRINEKLNPPDPQRVVKAGTSVVAMILNGLGFTNRRLYLTPQFFENKPVDKLLGEGIEASMLTDYTLGHTLDEISDYGTTKLYSEIAFDIALDQNLLDRICHLDTTSLSVYGNYAQENETENKKENEDDDNKKHLKITHGYSKDHRPDLKQVVLSLVVNGPSYMPIWMEALDGNSSDKISFHETIHRMNAFQDQIKLNQSFRWIADSALYSKDKLLKNSDFTWLSRVPETLTEAKILTRKPSSELNWIERGHGYYTASTTSCYGNIQQRWLLVYSEQAYQREKETFEKNVDKQQEQINKKIWHLKNELFQCESDAIKAFDVIVRNYPYFSFSKTLEPINRYSKKGRPKSDAESKIAGYHIIAEVRKNQDAITTALNCKGRFILATNELDENFLSDEKILTEYKEQQGVERGFRFLKDPWFMVDSIFLKSPKRIEALMMVMTLCLMVYNIAQYKLRQCLQEKQETIPNQLNKPVKNPTLRWIFQIMEGISLVSINNGSCQTQVFITNVNELRRKVIQLFGQTACQMYDLIPENQIKGLGT